ncbi:CpaF family protein [Methyloparacoccus murrellii]
MDLKERLRGLRNAATAPVEATPGAAPARQEPPAHWSAHERLVLRGLNESEREWQLKLYRELMEMIDLSVMIELEPAEARRQIRDIVQQLFVKHALPFNAASREVITRSVEDEILGLGPLEPLLDDPMVTDILVNGSQQIYVERHGKLELTPLKFHDDAHLMRVIDRIVTAVGRRIDESSPMVDARLKDGSRVNVIIPPLAIDGPCMSIRRFPAERLRTENLIALGTLTPAIAELMKAMVRGRLNILISGGTGSGKTTMLNVLSGYIPVDERIVTIEDAAELQLQQPHVVRLETRPANVEGKGEIKQRELVKNALRMRPERIILGEIRGEEAFDMLQAMNTGHDGSLATIHANSPRDALARLESMVAMSGIDLPAKMVHAQIASALDAIIQVARLEDGSRRLLSLTEVQGMEADVITLAEIFTFERRGLDDLGRVRGNIRATGVVPLFFDRLQRRGIAPPNEIFSL